MTTSESEFHPLLSSLSHSIDQLNQEINQYNDAITFQKATLSLNIPNTVTELLQQNHVPREEPKISMWIQLLHQYTLILKYWNSERSLVFLSLIGSRLYNTQLSQSDSDIDLALVYLEEAKNYLGLKTPSPTCPVEELLQMPSDEGQKSGGEESNLTDDIKIHELSKILGWIHYSNPSAAEYLFSCDDCLCLVSGVWDELKQKCLKDLITQKLSASFLGFARSQVGLALGRHQKGDKAAEEEQLSLRERRKKKRLEKQGVAGVVSVPIHRENKQKNSSGKGRMDWQKPFYHALRSSYIAQDISLGKKPEICLHTPSRLELLLSIRRQELSFEAAMEKYEALRREICEESRNDIAEDFDYDWLDQWLRKIRLESMCVGGLS